MDGKYRYLDTNSFFYGDEYTNDRSSVSDLLLKQESGTYEKKEGDDSDYTEAVTLLEITEESPHKVKIYCNPELSNHWTHKTVWRTGNFVDGINRSNLFIWLADVPFAQFGATSEIDRDLSPGNSSLQKVRVTSKSINLTSIGNYLYTESGEKFKLIKGEVSTLADDQYVFYCEKIDATVGVENVRCWIDDNAGQCEFIKASRYSRQNDNTVEVVDNVNSPFSSGDENTFIYWANGSMSLIVDVINNDRIIVKEFGLTPDLEGGYYYGLKVVPHTKIFNDYFDDDVLLGRKISKKPIYYLQTRQYLPLPDSQKGVIKDGFAFVKDKSVLKFSTATLLYRIGYYLPAVQYNNIKYGEINDIVEASNGIYIFGVDYTVFLDTRTYKDAGDDRDGEFIPFLYDVDIVSELNGKMEKTNVLKIFDSNTIVVIGQDKKIRTLSGLNYSENIGVDIQKNNLDKLYNQVILGYDSTNGLYVWSIER